MKVSIQEHTSNEVLGTRTSMPAVITIRDGSRMFSSVNFAGLGSPAPLGKTEEQGLVLMNKFKEMGYKAIHIEEAYHKYWQLYDKTSQELRKVVTYDKIERTQVSLYTRYNNKAPTIQKIFRKNWKILKRDPVLKNSLTSHPNLIFRRPKDLRSMIAPSRVKRTRTKGLNKVWTTVFDQRLL